MSKARLIITSVILEGRSQADVARDYHVSKSWVSKLITRYNNEGSQAFEPRSRKPHTTPTKTPPDVIELILKLRELDCHGVFGQWALLKWGFTESRDQYDHSTPEIFARVQR